MGRDATTFAIVPSSMQPPSTIYHLFIQSEAGWQPCCKLEFGRQYTLGRSRNNDIIVVDEGCSRSHLKFVSLEHTWLVEEMDASNPTYVEHERLTAPRPLNVGDVLAVGNKTLLLFSNAETVDRGYISSLIHHVKYDEGETRQRAQQDLVEHYFQQLCKLAKKKADGLDGRIEDAEDAVVSAWASFFKAMENGRLQKLDNRVELWKVLATFTARKVIRQRERQSAKKRDSRRTVTDSVLSGAGGDGTVGRPGIEGLADDALNHELEVAFQESVDTFLQQQDQQHREIAQMSLDGLSDHEIAQRMQCSERTIKRRIAEIRQAWNQFDAAQDE